MSKYIMTREEVINILENIDPQCQKDCPISRDDCAKQKNRCLVSDALEYAADFLSADMGKYIKAKDLELEVSHYLQCEKESEVITLEELKEIINRCLNFGADMRGEIK